MAQTQPAWRRRWSIAALLVVTYIVSACAKGDASKPAPGCTVASNTDTLVGMTQFMGNKNVTDSIWHDELPHFREHGPLSKLTLYRAFFYDGIWHDPGELKGMQFWYGPKAQPPIYTYLDGDANLFGARKPHLPQEFTLSGDELITKVELQWDPISMRYVSFTTSKGRELSWGFKDVAGATKAVAEAPVPGAYVAAIRGFEGKPAPVSKKRYIIQISVVWAVPSCKPAGSPAGSNSVPLEASRLANSKGAQGPTNVYLWDDETVALIPKGIEAANVVYDGVTISAPMAGTPVPTIPTPSVAQEKAPAPVTTDTSAKQQPAASQTTADVAPVHKVAPKAASAQTAPASARDPAANRQDMQNDAIDAMSADHMQRAANKLAASQRAAASKPEEQVAATAPPPAPAPLVIQDDEEEVQEKPAFPSPAAEGVAAVTAPQAQQQQQQQRGRWARVWSNLLG